MAGSFIIIDTGSIINLFASGGDEAWGQLLAGDRRLIVSDVILEELAQFADQEPAGSALKNIRTQFGSWISNKASVSQITWRPECLTEN